MNPFTSMPRHNSLTMSALAEKLGVSKSTVSRALRGSSEISPALREKIVRMAEEAGYRPNPSVSALMSQVRAQRVSRDETLAVVQMGRIDYLDSLPDSPGRRMLAAIRERAEQLGYKLDTLVASSEARSAERILQTIEARGIKGVVLMPLDDETPELPLDMRGDLAAWVAIGSTHANWPLNRVVTDHYGSVWTALENLKAQGFRRIGFCALDARCQGGRHLWQAAYLMWHRLHPDCATIPPWVAGLHGWGRPFLDWLEGHRPEVILCGRLNFEYSFEWNRLPRERWPHLVQLDFLVNRETIDKGPYLAAIDQNHREMGMAAVEFLAEQVQLNRTGLPERPRKILIPGRWEDASTPPLS